MPQTGDGIADKKEKEKRKTVTVVRRTMPERGRYGGFCLSTPLHAPRSPSTYTAVDVQQYVSYSSTCVGTGTSRGFPSFYDSPPSRGASDPSPGGLRTTLPARRVGHGTRYAPGTEKGCCVGGTWCHSETAGSRVELETRSRFLDVL